MESPRRATAAISRAGLRASMAGAVAGKRNLWPAAARERGDTSHRAEPTAFSRNQPGRAEMEFSRRPIQERTLTAFMQRLRRGTAATLTAAFTASYSSSSAGTGNLRRQQLVEPALLASAMGSTPIIAGVYGQNDNPLASGVYGRSTGSGIGVKGFSQNGNGGYFTRKPTRVDALLAESNNGNAVLGVSYANGDGVHGTANGSGNGVYGSSLNGYAGNFAGHI